jgi:cobalt-zinc-cadmium efflux system protein
MTHSSPHGHAHGAGGGPPQYFWRLIAVLALTGGFTLIEAIGGLLTGSLALLADAGHMLSDDLSLALALFASWIARRPPTTQKTFGYRRAEVLAALANGVTLVVISLWIFYEAYVRLHEPPTVLGGWMLAIAVAGLLVNAAGAAILWHGHRDNLNVAAALSHVLADLLGSVGAIVAALLIVLTGWAIADPLVSVFIGILVLYSSWSILRDSVNILLEATPKGISAEEIHRRMTAQAGIAGVHDLHIWTITSGFPALTAHVLVKTGQDSAACRHTLECMLAEEYGIEHTTLQVYEEGDKASERCRGMSDNHCHGAEPRR